MLATAHDPTINLLEQFCPCGCNANISYTSVSRSELVSHARPQTNEDWNNWWSSNNSWEEPNLSRTAHNPVWSALEKMKVLNVLNQRVEKILIRRMLPQYKKVVSRLVVGSLDPSLWSSWIRLLSNGAPASEIKQRTLRAPSHLPTKQKVPHWKVTWQAYMPKLSEVHPQWWRKKWVTEEDGIVYRAWITKLSFGYNPLTEIVAATMEYKTQFFHDNQNTWNSV